ncbi:MAG: hypothetical protein CMP47_09355 [Rickettsiales bacterium]|nr:hypothetical protein [Rickettsiales bacterium]
MWVVVIPWFNRGIQCLHIEKCKVRNSLRGGRILLRGAEFYPREAENCRWKVMLRGIAVGEYSALPALRPSGQRRPAPLFKFVPDKFFEPLQGFSIPIQNIQK